MKQHWKWVLLTAVVLGWLLDFLFWRQPAGINFAMYSLLCLAGGFLVMRLGRHRIAAGAAWLIPPILLFVILTFVRAEPLTLFLCVLLTLFLMALLAATFLGGRWLQYSLLDYAAAMWRLAWSIVARPLGYLAEIRNHESQQGGNSSGAALWPVVRGVLLALPILIVFAALLGSADVVFGRDLTALLQLLQLERLPEYVFRFLYMAIAAYALIGVFLHAASQSTGMELVMNGRLPVPQFLGFVESAIVLGSVAALFCAFVTVQFQYFFGGQANINVEGYTYAEYARRGFGELIVVAAFSLLMIMGLGTVTRRETRAKQRLFSLLSIIVVVLVSVILISAYQRLSLYEMAYGFSRLRTYVHVALVWIGLLLAAVVLLELMRRERLLAAAGLIASLGFAISLAALDVDGFIVRQNVLRAVGGQPLDIPYLVSLSTDADPALVEMFDAATDPTAVREALGAVLACRSQLNSRKLPSDWRAFTLSRWNSDGALHEIQGQLSPYRLIAADRPAKIATPGGAVYECTSSPN